MDGHDKEVTNSFSQAYDGIEEEIEDIRLVLTKLFMAKDIGLPRDREIWFKNQKIKEKDWEIVFKNQGMDISIFKKIILVTTLKSK